MPWHPETPFQPPPPLPPPDVDLEPRSVLKATVEARASLATLAQAGRLLPNPNVLIHAVPPLEAQASSEIENIVTTADELFRHADTGGGGHATKEALRYRRALFTGRSHPQPTLDREPGDPDLLEAARPRNGDPVRARNPDRRPRFRDCQDEIAERARAATAGGRDVQLLAVLLEQPCCRISTVVERCEVSRQTASTWLHALVDAGLLHEIELGRERLFVNHHFLDVLTRPD